MERALHIIARGRLEKLQGGTLRILILCIRVACPWHSTALRLWDGIQEHAAFWCEWFRRVPLAF